MASNEALLALMRETRRRLEAKTEPRAAGIDFSDLREVIQRAMPRDIDRQRRAAERPSPELRARLEAEGELARVLASDELSAEHYDNLSEAISERRAIEAEVDALVGDHDDVDTLPLLELRVPPMDAPLRALLWFAIRRSFAWLRNRWQARQLLALAEAEIDVPCASVDMRRAAAKAAEQRQRIAALRDAKRGGGHQARAS